MDAEIATVIPTRGNPDSQIGRALASVQAQTLRASLVIIIGDQPDGVEFTETAPPANLVHPEIIHLRNNRQPGYSGAVNTGLAHLAAMGFSGFVALLDDDDTWEPSHLECNLRCAQHKRLDVVVSGLRMIRSGTISPRDLPSNLKQSDFLVGNPGWQGSNTFVRLTALLRVGCFREGLISCNDRDLAIRLLDDPSVSIAYTGEWTANWHLNNSGVNLSARGSSSKRSGLAAFWMLYGSRMNEKERSEFFARAKAYFDFEENGIVEHAACVSTMHLLEEMEACRGN